MAKRGQKYFFIDPNRCIGCKACVEACSECDTHKGHSMIHLEFVDRSVSPQTVPVVCMHCDTPTCAEVCPADAIKRTADGVVRTARKPRCVACNNYVLACPFGVPKMNSEFELMMKCDMCYDRTSVGKQPMCTTVAPAGHCITEPGKKSNNCDRDRRLTISFSLVTQEVRTKVYMMVPREAQPEHLDVLTALDVDVATEPAKTAESDDLDPMLTNLHIVHQGG